MKCRSCGDNLKNIYDFGRLAMSDFTDKPMTERKYPLKLMLCQNCTLLQLSHDASPENLYSQHYWYQSGVNPIIVNDLREIVKETEREVEFKKNDIWIDIGANDGTLLSFVKKFKRIGIEPANNLQEELKKSCDVVIQDFWENVKFLLKAKVITAIGMFYDSPNPNAFIGNVAKHLANDGVFVAQLMTLYPMIKNNDLGNICHEHLEYYSYPALVFLLESNGLEIFKVEENDINGGSYRIFARKYFYGSVSGGINHKEPPIDFRKFIANIKRNKKDTVDFIRREVKRGKKVYGYGASTKGNTILQYYGLTNKDIVAIADRNPLKFGKFTIATKIPIVSEEEARKNADYFFILPYAFLDSFLEREKVFRKRGGKFIVSTPKFKIL